MGTATALPIIIPGSSNLLALDLYMMLSDTTTSPGTKKLLQKIYLHMPRVEETSKKPRASFSPGSQLFLPDLTLAVICLRLQPWKHGTNAKEHCRSTLWVLPGNTE
jgi:hypothetical protein